MYKITNILLGCCKIHIDTLTYIDMYLIIICANNKDCEESEFFWIIVNMQKYLKL